MKKLAVKYLLEFIVIVIGISLSFYVEEIDKQKDKEEFKNQSLNRILQNLESDIRDNKWNLKAVSKSIESGEWIYKNRKKLKKYSRDSIGFHLARANGFITIFVDNQEVTLTALEFRLLQQLVDRRGRVQTRDQLLSDVWGYSADITTRTVDTHIKRLREKLGPMGKYVQTIRGVGYKFSRMPD